LLVGVHINWEYQHSLTLTVGVPGEFTTMSGRRLRDTITTTLQQNGVTNPTVVIAGLANAYSHYITTYQEFGMDGASATHGYDPLLGIQRYEGASTLYGPHTLAGYQQEYSKMAAALATGKSYPPGPSPPVITKTVIAIFAAHNSSTHSIPSYPL
jgi:neutral ceramidase